MKEPKVLATWQANRVKVLHLNTFTVIAIKRVIFGHYLISASKLRVFQRAPMDVEFASGEKVCKLETAYVRLRAQAHLLSSR